MAAIASKLRDGYVIRSGTNRKVVREVYYITGLPFASPMLFETATGFPPQNAPAQPPYASAIRTDAGLIEFWNNTDGTTSAFAFADFTSNNPFSGGPRATSRGYTTESYEPVPVWRTYENQNGIPIYYRTERSVLRPAWRRVLVRFTTLDEDNVANLVCPNVGKWYVIGDFTYRFDGMDAESNGLGLTRLGYRFVTFGPLPAFPVGTFGDGHAVPLPALSPNAQYKENIPTDMTQTPTIEEVEIEDYLPGHSGGPLPELDL